MLSLAGAPGDAEGGARRRVSGVLVLVTPSCLGDRQRRAVGASRWRGVFALPGAPGGGGRGGRRRGSWSRAAGWWQGGGRGASPAVCLQASISDHRESNPVNHPELLERYTSGRPLPRHAGFSDSWRAGVFAERLELAVGPGLSRTLSPRRCLAFAGWSGKRGEG